GRNGLAVAVPLEATDGACRDGARVTSGAVGLTVDAGGDDAIAAAGTARRFASSRVAGPANGLSVLLATDRSPGPATFAADLMKGGVPAPAGRAEWLPIPGRGPHL